MIGGEDLFFVLLISILVLGGRGLVLLPPHDFRCKRFSGLLQELASPKLDGKVLSPVVYF